MKTLLKITTLLFAISVLVCCKKKEPVTPPIKNLAAGTIYSVDQLRTIATCTNSCSKTFNGQTYLIGTVLTDEVSGNFYKELYMRDRTGSGAIHLAFVAGKSALFIGDSIRVNLDGLDVGINTDSGILEIDSIDWEKSVTRFGTGPKPLPKVIDLASCGSQYTDYLGELITMNGIGFVSADQNKEYADVIGQSAANRIIQDGIGNQITVRTDKAAKFASHKTPTGYGSITGIATAYQGTNQMELRYESEVMMGGAAPTQYKKKDFNDNSITTGSWTSVSVLNGAVTWTPSTYNGAYFAKISGYTGGANTNSECWYISPSIDLSSSAAPALNFRTAAKFSGNALEVWVSTNYISGNPNLANWQQLNGFCLSPNTTSYVWTPSGTISLSSYRTAGVRIAFKYKSTTSGATTYELDDIYVREAN